MVEQKDCRLDRCCRSFRIPPVYGVAAVLSCLTLASAALAGDGTTEYHAVFIGNENYATPLPPCIKDAQDMKARLMSKPTWVQFAVDPANMVLTDQTAGQMLTAFKDRLMAADDDDIVVFYYSGHGGYLPDDNGDEPLAEPGDTFDETLVGTDGSHLRDDAFLKAIQDRKQDREDEGPCLVVILDSCFSGGVAPDRAEGEPKCLPCTEGDCPKGPDRASGDSAGGVNGFLADLFRSGGLRHMDGEPVSRVVTLAAVQYNEVASTGSPHSFFTEALLNHESSPLSAEGWFVEAQPHATTSTKHPDLEDEYLSSVDNRALLLLDTPKACCPPTPTPASSAWGIMLIVLLLVTGITIKFAWRRPTKAA